MDGRTDGRTDGQTDRRIARSETLGHKDPVFNDPQSHLSPRGPGVNRKVRDTRSQGPGVKGYARPLQRWVNPTCWIYPGLNKIVFVYPALKTKIPMTTACPPERHHHLCPRFSKMPAVPCALNLELFSLCCNTKTKTTPSKWMNSQWKEASSGFLQRNST